MNLDRGIEAYLEEVASLERGEPEGGASWPERRRQYAARCRHFDAPRPSEVAILDAVLPGPVGDLATRMYRGPENGPHGALVYFHGGGWTVGDLDTHDGVAAGLAATTGQLVISVDYRLAPEHPYPAAFDDAYTALLRVAEAAGNWGVDARRLIVAGDSAGANLAAAVALAARDRSGPRLAGQVLIYPALDARLSLDSHRANAAAPLLTTDEMRAYWDAYLGGRPPEPYAAPLEAQDLAGLPPAFVSAAAHDPLHDDGRLYAERLSAAGVQVEYREASDLPHGYLRARFMSESAAREFDAITAAVRRLAA